MNRIYFVEILTKWTFSMGYNVDISVIRDTRKIMKTVMLTLLNFLINPLPPPSPRFDPSVYPSILGHSSSIRRDIRNRISVGSFRFISSVEFVTNRIVKRYYEFRTDAWGYRNNVICIPIVRP